MRDGPLASQARSQDDRRHQQEDQNRSGSLRHFFPQPPHKRSVLVARSIGFCRSKSKTGRMHVSSGVTNKELRLVGLMHERELGVDLLQLAERARP